MAIWKTKLNEAERDLLAIATLKKYSAISEYTRIMTTLKNRAEARLRREKEKAK